MSNKITRRNFVTRLAGFVASYPLLLWSPKALAGMVPFAFFKRNSASASLFSDDVFSTYLYTGNSSTQTIFNGIQLGDGIVADTPVGQQAFTTPGTYSWTAPQGVTSVSVVCIGGGGGGGCMGGGGAASGGAGGGLGWKNNIPVVPGTSYTVVVGSGGSAASSGGQDGGAGGDSYFGNVALVKGGGGSRGLYLNATPPSGGGFVGDGGGVGGTGGCFWGTTSLGGGGAGGYSGQGGTGWSYSTAATDGAGGGGGGGGADAGSSPGFSGGGTGIFGAGTSGLAASGNSGGQGGSGGTNGSSSAGGGSYGAGGGSSRWTAAVPGSGGAVRIIWGTGRSFPATLTADQTVSTGTPFSGKGGMVWIKNRTNPSTPSIYDTVRGSGTGSASTVNKTLGTHSPSAEGLGSVMEYVNSFSSNGFSVTADGSSNNCNSSSNSYVSWTFRRAAKFFDVVSYAGDSTNNRQIAHSLGVAPGMIIIKRADGSSNWKVWHRSLADGSQLELDSISAAFSSYAWFGNAGSQTSSSFTVNCPATAGDHTNQTGCNYIAYLFAHDSSTDGVIQCGSIPYPGSDISVSVNLGWEPQWLLIKASGTTSQWYLVDSARFASYTSGASSPVLYPNLSNAEGGYNVQFTNSGFTLPAGQFPSSGYSYVYVAIRRSRKAVTTAAEVFKPVTRMGTNSAGAGDFNIGFTPDAALLCDRTNGTWNSIWDRLRGGNQRLVTRGTDTEATEASSVRFDVMNGVGFDSAGGTFNENGRSYVDYLFRRAPGVFDIVTYTGTGTVARSITHSLGVRPNLVILKVRSTTDNWHVYHDMGNSTGPMNQFNGSTAGEFYLNSSGAHKYDGPGFGAYMDSVSDTTFRTQDYAGGVTLNLTNFNYVAYLFATKAGISKIGTYTGSASDVVVPCGFTGSARFVLVKRVDVAGDWIVVDSARGQSIYSALNSITAEVPSTVITLTAGGFTAKAGTVANAAAGATYIFMAFA